MSRHNFATTRLLCIQISARSHAPVLGRVNKTKKSQIKFLEATDREGQQRQDNSNQKGIVMVEEEKTNL